MTNIKLIDYIWPSSLFNDQGEWRKERPLYVQILHIFFISSVWVFMTLLAILNYYCGYDIILFVFKKINGFIFYIKNNMNLFNFSEKTELMPQSVEFKGNVFYLYDNFLKIKPTISSEMYYFLPEIILAVFLLVLTVYIAFFGGGLNKLGHYANRLL